jgi:uncharacterized membrane protein YphA (DoxX/SURF4 family)
MRMLALSPLERLAGLAPLIVRVIVGVIMAAHGWQKLMGGPANFGAFLAQLGVPLPTLMGYVVTFVELVGGILLIVGLFSRLAALLLTIDLSVAIVLVKVNVGLIAPPEAGELVQSILHPYGRPSRASGLCSNPSESPEIPGKASRQKYGNLQAFCNLQKPPANYHTAFARRRSGVRIPSAPLSKLAVL